MVDFRPAIRSLLSSDSNIRPGPRPSMRTYPPSIERRRDKHLAKSDCVMEAARLAKLSQISAFLRQHRRLGTRIKTAAIVRAYVGAGCRFSLRAADGEWPTQRLKA
jgi:hypothetical protein